jgi:hypothetical protein
MTFTIRFSRELTEALAVGSSPPPAEFEEVAKALENAVNGDEILIVGHIDESELMKAFSTLLNDSLRDFNKAVTITIRAHCLTRPSNCTVTPF